MVRLTQLFLKGYVVFVNLEARAKHDGEETSALRLSVALEMSSSCSVLHKPAGSYLSARIFCTTRDRQANET
jgi:hypothetical protein